MHKICPRCGKSFDCKKDAIPHCQCSTVHLSDADRFFIHQHYDDCLCADCLQALKRTNVAPNGALE